MIQEIVVTIIGIIVCGILVYKLYKFFFVKNDSNTGCGCSGCHCNTSKRIK